MGSFLIVMSSYTIKPIMSIGKWEKVCRKFGEKPGPSTGGAVLPSPLLRGGMGPAGKKPLQSAAGPAIMQM